MALSDDEKARVAYHLGYPGTGDMSNFVDMTYDYVQNRAKLWTAMENVAVDQEDRCRMLVNQLDELEAAIPGALPRLKAKSVGTFKSNPAELGQIRAMYSEWQQKLANFLAVPIFKTTNTTGVKFIGGY